MLYVTINIGLKYARKHTKEKTNKANAKPSSKKG
jgi:hypothetical protein